MSKNFSLVVQYLDLSFYFREGSPSNYHFLFQRRQSIKLSFFILEKAVHQTIKLYGLAAGVFQTQIIIEIDENQNVHTILDNNHFLPQKRGSHCWWALTSCFVYGTGGTIFYLKEFCSQNWHSQNNLKEFCKIYQTNCKSATSAENAVYFQTALVFFFSIV